MKMHSYLRTILLGLITVSIWTNAIPAQGQKTVTNTKSPMIYHGGPIMTATPLSMVTVDHMQS